MKDDLIKELEEDMRSERSRDLWQRFGKSMVWVSVAIVAGTAVGVLWKDFHYSASAQKTHILIAGSKQLSTAGHTKALSTLAKVEEDNSAHYGLAVLRKAEAQHAAGDSEAARQTLQGLASRNGGDIALFASMAQLRLASADMGIAKDSPIAASLTEAKAWALVEAGKQEAAAPLFAALYHDETTPASLRERATLALQFMAPDMLDAPPIAQ